MKIIPRTAWVTVNRACNFRCQWCYASSSGFRNEYDMDYNTAEKIVKLVKESGIKKIILIGGEPTLWEHLFKFNDLCSSLSIETSLVTNAYAFKSDKFWNEYLSHKNTNIEISLKAYDEKSSLLITRNEDFAGLEKGIQKVTKELKAQISLVYSTLIEDNLVEMVSKAVDLGANYVTIMICKPMSENGKFIAPYTVEFNKMTKELFSSYNKINDITKGKINYTLNTPFCIWPQEFIQTIIKRKQLSRGGCQFQNRTGIIFNTEGTLIPCNSMFDCSIGKFGIDFSNTDTFLNLLNSEEVNNMYKYINSYPADKCIDCSMFEFCRGGCPIMWTVFNPKEIVKAI